MEESSYIHKSHNVTVLIYHLTRVSYSKSRCIADKQWVTGILIILFLL
ncbi:hypothetical protein [Rickettsia endosymbiont of Nabis limbatus]